MADVVDNDESRAVDAIRVFLGDTSRWERGRRAAERLHAATDRLNESLEALEDAFFARRALPAAVAMPNDREPEALVWDGEFLIVMKWRGDDVIRTPLLKASRERRVTASGLIGQLVAKLQFR